MLTVDVVLTLRFFSLFHNSGLNNLTNYVTPRACYLADSNDYRVPQLELLNKQERCVVKCQRYRNAIIRYNIRPRYFPIGGINYNVVCDGCDANLQSLVGIKDHFEYVRVQCLGNDADTGIYEMEVSTEYGKGYSSVYIQAELMEAFTGRLKQPSGPGQILFDNIELNEGYSYNKSTGIFKAKRTGYYSFYMMARTESDRYVMMELRKNGVRVGSITNDVLPDHSWEVEDGANALVLALKEGDETTVYSNGTLQEGSTLSLFSLRSLMESPQEVLYATVPDGTVIQGGPWEHIAYDDVHINTAQTFTANTNYTVASSGYYVVSMTTFLLDSAIHASYLDVRFKMIHYSTLSVSSRTSNSYTYMARYNQGDVIQNQFFTFNTTRMSNESSLALFKYFELNETDVTVITVRQKPFYLACEQEFCNPFANGAVYENLGSDFDPISGIFTVPRFDAYLISVNLFATQVDTIFQILVDGEVTDTIHCDGPTNDNFTNDSKLVLIKRLKEGRTIEVKMKGRALFYSMLSIWTLTA
ncbi:uncharacterized protein LOC133186281 [Saccostrea echinata]|uniref:uncharacterized protein LOC133186281 n=1 Tax=Saccostrea echinata TaxID=191078 RepID=UPI002A81002C|nr:uncharacterized protein LOC133186281 [Saccostrea echinata]